MIIHKDSDKITLYEFKKWLGQNSDLVVGRTLLSCCCPYANFLKHVLDISVVNVCADFFEIDGVRYKTPKGIDLFIKLLDQPPQLFRDPIIGARCLDLIEQNTVKFTVMRID